MNLKLHITKNTNLSDYRNSKYIRFAVIDTDQSKSYPANFVYVLPRHIHPHSKVKSKFQQRFKDKSPNIAKKLLTQALKEEEDKEIRKEIQERLILLQPKQNNFVKCIVCGKFFDLKNRYGKNICYNCKIRADLSVLGTQ